MKKLFVFLGDSGSGKTTLITELMNKHPDKFMRIVTCTSRSKRVGEENGKDYHFLSREFFFNNQDLVLVKCLENGDCYGTRKTELYSDTHHLLLSSKPTGVLKLVELGVMNIVVVRIAINKKLKIARMQHRGDTWEAISGRLKSDALTTTDVDLGQIPIIDLNASQTIYEKIEIVLKVC